MTSTQSNIIKSNSNFSHTFNLLQGEDFDEINRWKNGDAAFSSTTKAYFNFLHFLSDETVVSDFEQATTIGASIASPGGNYSGEVANNFYDDDKKPRRYLRFFLNEYPFHANIHNDPEARRDAALAIDMLELPEPPPPPPPPSDDPTYPPPPDQQEDVTFLYGNASVAHTDQDNLLQHQRERYYTLFQPDTKAL